MARPQVRGRGKKEEEKPIIVKLRGYSGLFLIVGVMGIIYGGTGVWARSNLFNPDVYINVVEDSDLGPDMALPIFDAFSGATGINLKRTFGMSANETKPIAVRMFPSDWITEQVIGVLEVFIPWMTAEKNELELSVDISAIKPTLSKELATLIQDNYSKLVACKKASDLSPKNLCRIESMDAGTFLSRVEPHLKAMIEGAPDKINLMDKTTLEQLGKVKGQLGSKWDWSGYFLGLSVVLVGLGGYFRKPEAKLESLIAGAALAGGILSFMTISGVWTGVEMGAEEFLSKGSPSLKVLEQSAGAVFGMPRMVAILFIVAGGAVIGFRKLQNRKQAPGKKPSKAPPGKKK